MISCGSMVLPSDFDIFRPSSSTKKPWVRTCPERRRAARAETDEQRALEPAAVLVAALEVEVRRPGQLRPERQHRLVARARVEPDVEDVVLALERRARRTSRTSGPRAGTPRSAARTTRPRRTRRRPSAARSTIAGVSTASPHAGAVERRDRHAPGALARDAPVGAVRDHVVDAVAAPGRDPLDLARRSREARLAQRPRAPSISAMALARRPSARTTATSRGRSPGCGSASSAGTGASNGVVVPQAAAVGQRFDDRRVRLEHLLARKQPDIVREPAVGSDRRVDVEPVLDARSGSRRRRGRARCARRRCPARA